MTRRTFYGIPVSADVLVILEVVDDAVRLGKPLAVVAKERLDRNTKRLADLSAAAQAARARSSSLADSFDQMVAIVADDCSRVRRLMHTYASWKTPPVPGE